MSAEATGWVYRHSPCKGASLLVHLAIADSVNDQYQNEFWMSPKRLAAKARCGRATVFTALAELVEGGFLTLLEPGDSRRHLPARYRFMFPDKPAVFDSRPSGPTEVDRGGRPANLVQPQDEVPNLVQSLDGVSASEPSPASAKPSPIWEPSITKPSPIPGLHKTNPSRTFTTTQEKQPKLELTREDHFTSSFVEFWDLYPKRNNRKIGKEEAEAKWRHIPPEQIEAVMRGVRNYRVECDRGDALAKDAHRWLTKRMWTEFQEAVPPSNRHLSVVNGPKPYSSSDIPTDEEYAEAIARAEASENGWGI